MIQLNYRDAKPIYEQIKDGLKHLLLSGAVAAGEKLPSVRELASSLAINPNTIQRAYKELENEGYIYSVSGKGTFAAEKQDVVQIRKDELFLEFDVVISELLYLSVEPKILAERIESLSEGSKKI
ncbi:MAG: GntR family transcriptional regulator [Lachnospiraceae bacterium]|uniref:GntR family transcriptional regulator n=1 Tax=Roseburia hominis TaxID=301301 RepID=UPI001F2067BC|nr:GntR family transcriptional regulator [Roseburia hominis]MCI5712289.1 GntR family transcriptional regulator [Lachnospiraceae bacterium]MDD6168682.1 GntR family transcriptional regulator [Lachnospiraceae bacterium]MDY4838159.1 GntR family transcriptional regulator [Lachnospiraceae bacterium]